MTTERFGEQDNRLYSQAAIAIATYLGGPVAAGALMRRNFINLGQEQWGKHAFFIGFIVTVMIFLGIFMMPEAILEKIPEPLIPAIYTGIIFLIVERLQGTKIKEHNENNLPFFSKWRAAGIGAIYLSGLLAVIFTYAYLSPDDFDSVAYDQGISAFVHNEEQLMEVFILLESWQISQVVRFIPERAIPLWQRNLEITRDIAGIEGLYPELKTQAEQLQEYAHLRIKSLELIRKGLVEDTDDYDTEIDMIFMEINEILENL